MRTRLKPGCYFVPKDTGHVADADVLRRRLKFGE
jgi:hypothetical protein